MQLFLQLIVLTVHPNSVSSSAGRWNSAILFESYIALISGYLCLCNELISVDTPCQHNLFVLANNYKYGHSRYKKIKFKKKKQLLPLWFNYLNWV